MNYQILLSHKTPAQTRQIYANWHNRLCKISNYSRESQDKKYFQYWRIFNKLRIRCATVECYYEAIHKIPQELEPT